MIGHIANLRNYLLEKYNFFDKDLEKIIVEFYYGEHSAIFQHFIIFCQHMSMSLDNIYEKYVDDCFDDDFGFIVKNKTGMITSVDVSTGKINILTSYKPDQDPQYRNLLNYYEPKNINDYFLDIEKLIILTNKFNKVINYDVNFTTQMNEAHIYFQDNYEDELYYFQTWLFYFHSVAQLIMTK